MGGGGAAAKQGQRGGGATSSANGKLATPVHVPVYRVRVVVVAILWIFRTWGMLACLCLGCVSGGRIWLLCVLWYVTFIDCLAFWEIRRHIHLRRGRGGQGGGGAEEFISLRTSDCSRNGRERRGYSMW